MAAGSLFSLPFIKYGRWNCIIYTNILIIIGSVMGLFPKIDWLFKIGRFIFGLAGGSFGVFSVKYINEMAPTEIKGSVGGLT